MDMLGMVVLGSSFTRKVTALVRRYMRRCPPSVFDWRHRLGQVSQRPDPLCGERRILHIVYSPSGLYCNDSTASSSPLLFIAILSASDPAGQDCQIASQATIRHDVPHLGPAQLAPIALLRKAPRSHDRGLAGELC